MPTNQDNLEDQDELWTADQQSPLNWPKISRAALKPDEDQEFGIREEVLTLRLVDGVSMRSIEKKTGFRRHRTRKLIKRALTPLPNGQPAGFLACIPNLRIKQYERVSERESGYAGLMTQFLNKHKIYEEAERICLGKKTRVSKRTVHGRVFKNIYKHFKRLCIDAGVDVLTEYPFTNADEGREAVRNFADRVRGENFLDAVRVEEGSTAYRMAASSGKKHKYSPVSPLPYQCAQLDGHLLDAVITVTDYDGDGNEVYLPLARLWLIVLMDVASRAVLGYSISFKHNYSSQDVVNCFAKALDPWQKVLSPNPKPVYLKGAGLPSGVIKQCEGRLFNQLRIDNAMAHRSSWLRDRIMNCGVSEIIYNKPAAPRQNAIVERFMGSLEEMSLHQMGNTTGSNPSDIRRRNPEKEAAKLRITADHLIQIMDMTVANYNATTHRSLNSRSPLEYIEYHLNQPHLPPRYHTGESINDLSLYERDFSVTIRAKKEQGHPPSVKFKDGIYTSDELRLRGDLENRKAFLRVNVNDIRYGTLFDLKGTYVADVVVDERWLRMEHSLATRQAILKLVNQKYIASKDQDPVGSYVEYLEEAGKSDKKARTKAEEFKRSNQGKEDDLEDDDFPDSPKPPSDDDDDEDPGSISFDDHDLSS